MSLRSKILLLQDVPAWRARFRATGGRLVVTNGCFDLLHAGHVTYLENARAHGDALLVGLNGDASVRQLKGPGRPVNGEEDRAVVLAALESVSAVAVFPEKTAAQFLSIVRPDIYVKGGDYTVESLNPEEREVITKAGGRIVIIPFLPGKSTTALLQKVQST